MNNLAKKDQNASVVRHNRRKVYGEAKLKPQPLILEQQHRNIGTLIALLAAIIIGLGSGWLAGDILKSDVSPEIAIEHVQANTGTQDNQEKAPVSSEVSDSESKPLENNSEIAVARRNEDERGVIEEQSSRRTTRTSSGRHAVVTRSAGEPLPLAILKGKPLRKAFRPLKRVKFW